ncbi:MAG: hypothetical protein HY423_12440 [Candidatus Lambdaproteobacteria bacterium]|nr:hypothetical protein [Candidatus Lambdaproteobacteria bacterium]
MKAPAAARDNRAQQRAALQRRVAQVERWGTRVALTFAIGALALYMTGALAPYVPAARLVTLWGEDLSTFRAQTGLPAGWDSFRHLRHSDMIAIAGIVSLILVTILAYVALLPQLVRQRDWAFLVVVLLQLAVFLAVALLPLG